MSEQKENRVYKVVITGFGPFQGVPRNESWLAVSDLSKENFPSNIQLVIRELKVVYDSAKNEICKLWKEEDPDLIIHVGVSKNDTKISVEKQAFNTEYHYNDISDQCPDENCCFRDAPEVIQTKLDVDHLCEFSNQIFKNFNSDSKCGPSVDPGRYLCGFSYFTSLYHDEAKSLFVHVPDEKTIPIKDMTIAIKSIIFDALRQLYGFQVDTKQYLEQTIQI